MRLPSIVAFGLRSMLAYVVAWPVALFIVLWADGMLEDRSSVLLAFLKEYVASLPYMVTPGRELATMTQLLSVVLAIGAPLIWVVVKQVRQGMAAARSG